MTNVHEVSFSDNQIAGCVESLYQYDYGQILKFSGIDLPVAYEVHFAKTLGGTAITNIGNSDGVAIPDSLLQSSGLLYAWVYLHTGETDGETRYVATLVVRARAGIDYTPQTPEEQTVIAQAIIELNKAIVKTAQNVNETNVARQGAEDARRLAEQEKAEAMQAKNNAIAALEAAEQAQRNADQSASDASESAGQAVNSALSASRYANAALQSANNAADSARLADNQYRLAKEQAENASNSADDAAGSAQVAAQQAQNAQESAESATDNVERISEISGHIDQQAAAIDDAARQIASMQDRTAESAESATESAGNAERSEQAAAESENESKKWAVGIDLDGNPVSSDTAQYENSSKYHSEQAAQAAEYAWQAVNQTGYMDFYMDDDGYLWLERTANTQIDFTLEEGELIALWPATV